MNPAVQGFLDKFSKDAEDLIRNVAAFNQLAHIQNHSYKQSTHPCHQKFPRRPEPPSQQRPSVPYPTPPKKKTESAAQGTQTCQCLYKQVKSTNTEKGRKSITSNNNSQNSGSSSPEYTRPCAQKRPSSMQTPKRCFHGIATPKSHSSSNKKRSCCDDDDGSSMNSQKSDKCVCKSNQGAPVDIQDTNMEIGEFTDKFYDAQRSLQILKNRIADLNYYMNEGEAKMKSKKNASKMCPPCPPGPSFGSNPGYGVPDLPSNAMPDLPPVKVKKLIPRNKYLEQGGIENDFSFNNMPVMPPHAVPILPGTMVSLARTCTPRSSGRSNQRVSFNGCN